jgi:hypothetical protein
VKNDSSKFKKSDIDEIEFSLSLTKVDSNNSKTLRRLKRFKKDNQIELIKDISISKETKLSLITDVNNDDELEYDYSSFDDDQKDEDSLEMPKNDYCQHFVDTGQRPQNFIRDPGLTERLVFYLNAP